MLVKRKLEVGQGAGLIASYDYGRTAEIEITDALASMYSLQYLWGGKLNNSGLKLKRQWLEKVLLENQVDISLRITK